MRTKTLHVYPVEAAEIARIGEPAIHFGYIGEGAIGQRQRVLYAFEHLACLSLDAADDDLSFVIGGHLAGDENEVTGAGGGRQRASLTVRSEGRLT